MQVDRMLPAAQPAPPDLADLIAAGELTCSASQAAQFLHVSTPTVIAAARRGELPGRQVGKQWRFSCRALVRMFEENAARPAGDDRG